MPQLSPSSVLLIYMCMMVFLLIRVTTLPVTNLAIKPSSTKKSSIHSLHYK